MIRSCSIFLNPIIVILYGRGFYLESGISIVDLSGLRDPHRVGESIRIWDCGAKIITSAGKYGLTFGGIRD